MVWGYDPIEGREYEIGTTGFADDLAEINVGKDGEELVERIEESLSLIHI